MDGLKDIMENLIKLDDLGVPLFQETLIIKPHSLPILLGYSPTLHILHQYTENDSPDSPRISRDFPRLPVACT
jgi:hypothetical protein